MNKCDDCKHAEWKLTASGRKHPDGTGKCRKAIEWVAAPIPACSYWIGPSPPKPSGFMIKRGRVLKTQCVYWAKAEGRT
jgi:hypothetical protein